MKKFDRKQLLALLGKLLSFIRYILSGSEEDRKALLIDNSTMQKKPHGTPCHFLFVLIFGLSIAAALWQHGSPRFTIGMILLLIPVSFFVYVPYRFMDILLRQLTGCLIFLGSCLWLVYRLRMDVMFDIAFIEVLIMCTFSFFINGNRRDYTYIALISILLIIYSGLIPRKLLLYLIPGAIGGILISFAVERLRAFSGSGILHDSNSPAPLKNLGKTWHFYLILLLMIIPIFLLIFSLIPLKTNSDEGFFEVSFSTSRRSVMPPDLKKWLRQDRKFVKDENASDTISGDAPDVADKRGKKKVESDQPGEEMGSGKSAPPGKDLLFTVNMPVKLYHLAALYDFYDGKKWITSQKFTKSHLVYQNRTANQMFQVESKYTILKWISPSLYAPYRPIDFTNHINTDIVISKKWNPQKYHIKQNHYSGRLRTIQYGYPEIPYVYSVRSNLVVPVKPEPPAAKKLPPSPEIKAPAIYTSAGEYFARITEKENQRREQLRIAAEKRAAAKKAAEEKRAAAKKAAEEKRAAAKKRAEEAKKRAVAAKKATVNKNKNTRIKQKQIAAKKTSPAKKPTTKAVTIKKPATKAVIAKKTPPKKTVMRKPVRKPVTRKPVRKPTIARDPAWRLSLPASHFLQLPEKLSPKIAELAKNITKNVHTPYEKAIALRDHLRSHYTYKLYANPVPADKESVEYFLFELKEGHCEYFAAALTILARSIGLPARVATGFSPGNYNAMTGLIEVYEYHAHAWSQIFIAGTGWLTFDAVPPADIISETTPVGIGRFRDPFGDEWRIMPPELTQEALQYIRKELEKEAAKLEAERLMQLEAKKRKAEAKQTVPEKKKITKKNIKTVEKKVRQVKPTGIKERLQTLLRDGKAAFKKMIKRLLVAPETRKVAIIVVITTVILLICFRRILAFLRLLIYRHRFISLLERAGLIQENDPAESILCCYRALRLLLILARMERRKNMELLVYASAVRALYSERLSKRHHGELTPEAEALNMEKSEQMEQDLRLVFHLYYSLEYGNCPCSSADAVACKRATTSIHTALKELQPYSLLP